MIVPKMKHDISPISIIHLSTQCNRMGDLIKRVGEIESYYITDPFIALANSIIYQSISFVAATAVWNRFLTLVVTITPSTIMNTNRQQLRDIGLSNSKVQYIYNIARSFIEGDIITNFGNMSNSEIQSELQKIKGIGPWTSEMFLIFCLNRKDVMSYGDIAIRRGLEFIHNLDHNITKKEFEYYKDLYSPHQTVASFYLWEITLRKLFNETI